MRGIDLRTIQELMGHRDITTTMRYVHFAPGKLREPSSRHTGAESEELQQETIAVGDK
jgi:site-specific recombinase XerD